MAFFGGFRFHFCLSRKSLSASASLCLIRSIAVGGVAMPFVDFF
jgi:hypothetical protein